MRWSSSVLAPALVLAACVTALAQGPTYRLGRAPSEQEIKAWDIAISPDGKELPPGKGTAKEGALIYIEKCATCHGENLKEGRARVLVGGKDTLTTATPVRTPWSWPYATTIWDFINRAMPLNNGGTLKADEVYALTAFILYRNEIIKETDVIDAQSLPKIEMPFRSHFDPPHPGWKPGMKRPLGLYP